MARRQLPAPDGVLVPLHAGARQVGRPRFHGTRVGFNGASDSVLVPLNASTRHLHSSQGCSQNRVLGRDVPGALSFKGVCLALESDITISCVQLV